MQAGQLRHKIAIVQAVDSITPKGDDEITYDEAGVTYAYASIEPLSGREFLFAKQIRADITHKITMRYRISINHRTKIRWYDGITLHEFNVGPVINQDLRNTSLTFYAIKII